MIIRTAQYDRFTVLPNAVIDDHHLSWKARGLLCYLLAKPDGWRTSAGRLARTGPDGRDAVRSGLAELEERGYLLRRREQDASGRWSTVTWVYDCRQTVHNLKTGAGLSDAGKPGPTSNTDVANTEVLQTPVPPGAACGMCAGQGRTHYGNDVEQCTMCGGSGVDPR
ncbi:MAG: helix-turn-helix domain-containing protein [Ilumatobacteraceae bacterium]|jgi:hypothetical protein